MKAPSVFAVVLNRNGREDIEQCIAALKHQTFGDIRTCVSDNASDDGSPEWVESHHPDVQVLRNARNLGWTAGNNKGIEVARGVGARYVWLLNNDVDLEPDCVERLVDFMEHHASVGIAGPMIYYYAERRRLSPIGGVVDWENCDIRDYSDPAPIEAAPVCCRFLSGSALFIRREVFERVGVLDERFFIYCDDVDFCVRAAAAGFGIELVQDAQMYHKISAYSGGKGAVNPWRTYQGLRSGLLFWRKHAGWWRFHRVFCGGHLGKWLKRVELIDQDDLHRRDALAVIDAIWYVLAGKRDPYGWPESPEWFRRFVIRRPWLIGELMSFRFFSLLFPRRTA